MPIDKPKPPFLYPICFHTAVQQLGEWNVLDRPTKAEIRCEARRFRAFIKSLSLYPLHPTAQAAADWSIRTRTVWHPPTAFLPECWELCAVVTKTLTSCDFRRAEK